ncbi:hypothetical protein HPB52_014021 [Rhipicephalus sanguineus]|uniref:Uncharacterized protein n=1 Tax=Rhipicephalus sanguineus TaxID=34632 RepID=A0A9D4PWH0_RHISA|nr:hypothetical protein HPB52_014021 [Rhipicephalus sanguineus]
MERQRQLRLEFAPSVEEWMVEEWHEVIFTDESTFSSRWAQQHHAWRPMNCSGHCAVSACEAISKDGLDPLCELLQEVLVTYALELEKQQHAGNGSKTPKFELAKQKHDDNDVKATQNCEPVQQHNESNTVQNQNGEPVDQQHIGAYPRSVSRMGSTTRPTQNIYPVPRLKLVEEGLTAPRIPFMTIKCLMHKENSQFGIQGQ